MVKRLGGAGTALALMATLAACGASTATHRAGSDPAATFVKVAEKRYSAQLGANVAPKILKKQEAVMERDARTRDWALFGRGAANVTEWVLEEIVPSGFAYQPVTTYLLAAVPKQAQPAAASAIVVWLDGLVERGQFLSREVPIIENSWRQHGVVLDSKEMERLGACLKVIEGTTRLADVTRGITVRSQPSRFATAASAARAVSEALATLGGVLPGSQSQARQAVAGQIASIQDAANGYADLENGKAAVGERLVGQALPMFSKESNEVANACGVTSK